MYDIQYVPFMSNAHKIVISFRGPSMNQRQGLARTPLSSRTKSKLLWSRPLVLFTVSTLSYHSLSSTFSPFPVMPPPPPPHMKTPRSRPPTPSDVDSGSWSYTKQGKVDSSLPPVPHHNASVQSQSTTLAVLLRRTQRKATGHDNPPPAKA